MYLAAIIIQNYI